MTVVAAAPGIYAAAWLAFTTLYEPLMADILAMCTQFALSHFGW